MTDEWNEEKVLFILFCSSLFIFSYPNEKGGWWGQMQAMWDERLKRISYWGYVMELRSFKVSSIDAWIMLNLLDSGELAGSSRTSAHAVHAEYCWTCWIFLNLLKLIKLLIHHNLNRHSTLTSSYSPSSLKKGQSMHRITSTLQKAAENYWVYGWILAKGYILI
jgi:hypothetical protein